MSASTNQDVQPVKLYHTTYCPPNTDHENRSPIIFLHGIGATSGTWKEVKADIGNATKRKIICVELRNHGRSEWPDVFSMEHVIADLENFMSEQNLPKAIFLGHSFGGRAVLGLSFKRPEMVERLLLEDTPIRVDSSVWKGVKDKLFLLADVIKKLPKTLAEDEAQNLVWKHCEMMFPEETRSFRKNRSTVVPFYKDKKSGCFKCYFDLDLESKIGDSELNLSNSPTYNGKCLIMLAEKSNYHQKSDVDERKIYMPNSREVYIIKGTHALHIENPHQFIKEVTKFINED